MFGEIKINGGRIMPRVTVGETEGRCQEKSLSVEVRIWKSLANAFFDSRLFFGTQQPAIDAAAHRIEQFQPIFQRRIGDVLPLIETTFASEETPLSTDMLGIALQWSPIFGGALPTYFSFGHVR